MKPIDGRKGIDGLAAVCRPALGEKPWDGAVSVFRPRAGTTLNLLAYAGQGFWLCTQRLSPGRLRWWPTAATPSVRLAAREVGGLLWKGFPDRAQLAPEWRRRA